jgi:2-polyprenyl-3-methyl-5-hydroxy-6-metoxy-1,4-benzoquinol methylase
MPPFNAKSRDRPDLLEANTVGLPVKAPSSCLKKCCVCSGARLHYLFSIEGNRVVRCDDCGLLLLNPQPPRAQMRNLYFENQGEEDALKFSLADYYLDLLRKYGGAPHGRLLEIECGAGDFLRLAERSGYDVVGLDPSPAACEKARGKIGPRGRIVEGELYALKEELGSFDVCVIIDVIENVNDPRAFLTAIHALLKPGGVLFIAAPSLSSPSKFRKKYRWKTFKPGRLFYFDDSTLESLLFHSAFHHIIRQTAKSGATFMARSHVKEAKQKLSIIVPAFNEEKTIKRVMDHLVAKRLENLDSEIIVVESHSTDRTREIVSTYSDDPRVKLVLEESPRGKGHAVRAGFARATGDFILIQDADLEYDFDDYDLLMEPLIAGKSAFVLGARHGGRLMKLRTFRGAALSAFALNIGHWVFCALVDVFFWVPLRDPFTMFKVFRRDCLYGLSFECDRFDFDIELLIKLVRKGYTPLEIPVNYNSRSFDQGKKVSVWRDPWTWLRAIFKFRLARIDPLEQISADDLKSGSPTA